MVAHSLSHTDILNVSLDFFFLIFSTSLLTTSNDIYLYVYIYIYIYIKEVGVGGIRKEESSLGYIGVSLRVRARAENAL